MSGVTDLMSKTGPIARQHQEAIRGRAMKRWLRAHGVPYSARVKYSESGLRKLVREFRS